METKYAILMIKINLSEDIYYFNPSAIIEGQEIIEDDYVYFQDTIGMEYFPIYSGEMTYSENQSGVGYIISESDLLAKYPDCSIVEAKSRYFDEIYDISSLGFYLPDRDIIALVPLNLKEMFYNLSLDDLHITNHTINLDASKITQPELSNIPEANEEKMNILINEELFNDLISSKTYDEVMTKLNQIKNFIDNDEIIEKKEYWHNGQELLDIFNQSYEAFASLDNLDEMKKSINELIDYYTELSVWLDTLNAKNTNLANEFLYTLVNTYDRLLKLNDLELIKASIRAIHESSKQRMQKIAKNYATYQNYLRPEEMPVPAIEDKSNNKTKLPQINVPKMKKYLDKVVIGQEEAKRDVISTIVMNKVGDKRVKKSCLLVGPTGSGKTLIAETISEYLDIPLLIVDTTQLTMPGYVGASIEDFLRQLLVKANGIVEKAEEGIIVFDEIDKKGSESNSHVSGKGVLNTFLAFFQGTTYNVEYNGRMILFNTSKLTILATGAFTDVAEAKAKNSIGTLYHECKAGYLANLETKPQEDITYVKLEQEDFVKYGHMPVELIGRFNIIVQLSGHTKESLKNILLSSSKSPLILLQKKLSQLNIQLMWTEGYIDNVIEQAMKLKTGARSLSNIVEYSIKKALWEVLMNLENYSAILLLDNAPIDNNDCVLITKDNRRISLNESQKLSRKLY